MGFFRLFKIHLKGLQHWTDKLYKLRPTFKKKIIASKQFCFVKR